MRLRAAAYGIKAGLEWQGILKPRKATRKVEVKKKVATAADQDEWLKGTNFNQVFACSTWVLLCGYEEDSLQARVCYVFEEIRQGWMCPYAETACGMAAIP